MKGRGLAAWIATVSCSTMTLLHVPSNELVVYWLALGSSGFKTRSADRHTWHTSRALPQFPRAGSGLMSEIWLRPLSCLHILSTQSAINGPTFDAMQGITDCVEPFMTHWLTTCTARFNIQQFHVLPTQCIYVFCVSVRTNRDTQHYLAGFINESGCVYCAVRTGSLNIRNWICSLTNKCNIY
jgi:hypothetical protein